MGQPEDAQKNPPPPANTSMQCKTKEDIKGKQNQPKTP